MSKINNINLYNDSFKRNTLEIVKKAKINIYSQCNLNIENFFPENESSQYFAHTYTIKNKKNLFRIAKKTPTKQGWFVTIWKRNTNNIIAPYDISDKINFVVIAIYDGHNIGEFIFPKNILIKKNIFSIDNKGGKRAIRVYTPWDKTTNTQSIKTQKWQSQFFINLKSTNSESTLKKINNLYSI